MPPRSAARCPGWTLRPWTRRWSDGHRPTRARRLWPWTARRSVAPRTAADLPFVCSRPWTMLETQRKSGHSHHCPGAHTPEVGTADPAPGNQRLTDFRSLDWRAATDRNRLGPCASRRTHPHRKHPSPARAKAGPPRGVPRKPYPVMCPVGAMRHTLGPACLYRRRGSEAAAQMPVVLCQRCSSTLGEDLVSGLAELASG